MVELIVLSVARAPWPVIADAVCEEVTSAPDWAGFSDSIVAPLE